MNGGSPPQLEGYQLLSELGHGGFGTVWYAEDDKGRGCAIKVLHRESVRVSDARERFEREARILLELDHPCVVAIESFSTKPQPYIVMEFLRGPTLREVLEDRAYDKAPLHADQVLRIITQLCDAIAAAHAQGAVHRDLKPQNIIVVDENTLALKILDFGLASLMNADLHNTTTLGRAIGSRMYMSPEQIRGGRVSPATDIFALSTILFELCTLRRPWLRGSDGRPPLISETNVATAGNGPHEVLTRILSGERLAISDFRSDLPAAFDEVLKKGWAPQVSARFEDVPSFAEAVTSALSVTPREITQTVAVTRAQTHLLPQEELPSAEPSPGFSFTAFVP
ncbi:MAG: serine/threonine-protein kinase, partial [Myxococcota bacterium]